MTNRPPSHRRARAATLWVAGIAAAALAGFAPSLSPPAARAQERAPSPSADEAGDHQIRGRLAWRRAVWSSRDADYERAARELRAGLDAAPARRTFTDLFLLGHALCRLHRTEEAGKVIEEAKKLAPQLDPMTPTEAILAFAEAVWQTSADAGWRAQPTSAAALRLLDDFVVRISTYRADAPFAAELRYLGRLERGMREMAEGKLDAALRDLEEAASLARREGRPISLELGRLLVDVHRDLGQQPKAKEVALELLRRDPGEPTHYSVLGRLTSDGDTAESARWQRRALTLAPHFAESHAKLAYLAWVLRDAAAMRRHLEAFESILHDVWDSVPGSQTPQAAANLQSGWGLFWMLRGEALLDAGDAAGARAAFLEAKTAFLESYARYPACSRTLTSLMKVLAFLGEPQSEIDVWDKRLENLRRRASEGAASAPDTFC